MISPRGNASPISPSPFCLPLLTPAVVRHDRAGFFPHLLGFPKSWSNFWFLGLRIPRRIIGWRREPTLAILRELSHLCSALVFSVGSTHAEPSANPRRVAMAPQCGVAFLLDLFFMLGPWNEPSVPHPRRSPISDPASSLNPQISRACFLACCYPVPSPESKFFINGPDFPSPCLGCGQ